MQHSVCLPVLRSGGCNTFLLLLHFMSYRVHMIQGTGHMVKGQRPFTQCTVSMEEQCSHLQGRDIIQITEHFFFHSSPYHRERCSLNPTIFQIPFFEIGLQSAQYIGQHGISARINRYFLHSISENLIVMLYIYFQCCC